MGEHTPGPWEARFVDGLWAVCGPDDWVAAYSNDKGSSIVFMDSVYETQDIANAHLIATAPDLYDFAEKFVVWAEDMPDENYEQVEIGLIAMAKTAIAKAKEEGS